MTSLEELLKEFEPISLDEMGAVKLMNRVDTKYVVPREVLASILKKAEKAYFVQETNGERMTTYDTLYYDTVDLDMYLRHHDRQLVRQKIRVRQYVESRLYFLEIKRKNNKGRTKKKRISLQTPSIEKPSDEIRDFIASKSRYSYDEISPKLRTTFRRITLVNKAKTERLTIDSDLLFQNLVTGLNKTYPNLVIIELKRNSNVPSPMLGIMIEERVHPFKISKYCIGTALTNPHVKTNRFKYKIRKIEKIIGINH